VFVFEIICGKVVPVESCTYKQYVCFHECFIDLGLTCKWAYFPHAHKSYCFPSCVELTCTYTSDEKDSYFLQQENTYALSNTFQDIHFTEIHDLLTWEDQRLFL